MTSAPSDFHQLLDAAPDAMVVVDRQGIVIALNVEAQRFFGWTENELLGEPQVGSAPVLEKLRSLGVGYAQGRAVTSPVPLTDPTGRVMMHSLALSA